MRTLVSLAAAAGVAVPLALGLGAAGSPASSRVQPPPGDTIVEVTGDKENGFEIHYYDGTALYPPTDSEALAECSEYDRRVQRVRCRTQVRVWYRDLGDLKQALNWAHAQA